MSQVNRRPRPEDLLPVMTAAKFKLLHDKPYFAAALLRMRPVPVEKLATMAVDEHWRLYYDPELTWTVEQTVTVLQHELGHLLRDHAGRAKLIPDCIQHIWNVAADAEINDDMASLSFPWPPVTHKTISNPSAPIGANLLVEEYYRYLLKHAKKIAICQESEGEGQDGGDMPKPGSGKCGSCAHGEKDGEGDGDGEGKIGGIDKEKLGPLPPGLSDVEKDLIRRCVAREIAETSKSRGTVPAGWERWAKLVLEPKVDWRLELLSNIRWCIADVAGLVDYSYKRPSRRQSAYGDVIQPSLRRPAPSVGIVFDTSGSMDDAELSQGLAEVGEVLNNAGLTGIQFISCDAAANQCKKVFTISDVQLFGGGGTDMGVGLAVLAGEKELSDGSLCKPPDIAIVITDGYTPWPAVAPSRIRKTIIVLVGRGKGPLWATSTIQVALDSPRSH